MERVWCAPSCSRTGKAESRYWTLTCTHRTPTMAEKLAATHLGIDPEQQHKGARFMCEPPAFPAGLVLAKEVVKSLAYYSVSAPRQCEPYVGYIVGWSEPTRWSMVADARGVANKETPRVGVA